VNSFSVGVDKIKGPAVPVQCTTAQFHSLTEDSDESPVSKLQLQPEKPVISSVGDTVLSVAQMLANKRGYASLVILSEIGIGIGIGDDVYVSRAATTTTATATYIV